MVRLLRRQGRCPGRRTGDKCLPDSWLRPKPPGPAPHTTMGSLDRSAMRIRILVTGGTFDKEYDELSGRLFFKDTHLPEMLGRGRCMLDVQLETVMMIDSLEMDDAGRERIVDRARSASENAIVISHGTDTMVETARALARAGIERQDNRPHRSDGPVRVRQFRRALQSRECALVRPGTAAWSLCRDERPAFSMGRRAQEQSNGMLRAGGGGGR